MLRSAVLRSAAFVLPWLLSSLLSGCGSFYNLSVNALAAPEASAARTYVLYPGMEGVTPEDLEYQEYSTYVRRALAHRGFVPAADPAQAQVVVIVSYGISDPQQQLFTYSVPQYGQTGISTSQTTGTIDTHGDTSYYSATTTYQPSYGVTGYNTAVGTRTEYTRWLGIFALDAASVRNAGTPKQLWETTVLTTGSSGDLRLVFPIMVAAAETHLGTATDGKAVDVILTRTSPEVKRILGDDSAR